MSSANDEMLKPDSRLPLLVMVALLAELLARKFRLPALVMVALFDDAGHPTPLAQHTPIAGRVVDIGGQDGDGGAGGAVVRDQPFDRFDGEQGHVAGQDENRPRPALPPRLQHRVAGAQPLPLDDRPHVGAGHPDDFVSVGRHDEDDAVGERPGNPERVGDQGAAAQPVEHLGLPGAHALAFARGQDDDGQRFHAVFSILASG